MSDPLPPPSFGEYVKVLPKWRRPLGAANWAFAKLAYLLSRLPLVAFLEYVGKLGLLGAIVLYIAKTGERQQEAIDSKAAKEQLAWQTLNSAVTKPGNAGRTEALSQLHSDGISLRGTSLVGKALIEGPLDLNGADLSEADLTGATFKDVDFSRATFKATILNGATFSNCRFDGASFVGPDPLKIMTITNALFIDCDFGSSGHEPTNFRRLIFKSTATFSLPGDTNALKAPTFSACNFYRTEFYLCGFDDIAIHDCNFAFANIISISVNTNSSFFFCNFFDTQFSYEVIEHLSHECIDYTNITSFSQWTNWCWNFKVAHGNGFALLPFMQESTNASPDDRQWRSNLLNNQRNRSIH